MELAKQVKIQNNTTVIETYSTQVYNQIVKFLKQKEKKSKKYESTSTSEAYGRDIKDFFKLMRNKEIEFLSKEDMKIELEDIEDFVIKLKDSGKYSNSTINRKIVAIRKLLSYLNSKKINEEKIVKDISYFSQIQREMDDTESYGILSVEESYRFAQLAKEERVKGEIKSLFFLFALDTALRKDEILSLKWSNIREEEGRIRIIGVGKGNKEFRKEISNEFYERLLTLKKDKERVFDISVNSIDDSFRRIREKMELPKERKIVFHSIRKSGVTFVHRITKDPFATMKYANHKSFNTTQIYLEEDDYGAIGAVSSKDSLNMNKFKEVDHETLLKALETMDKSYLILLNKTLSDIKR